MVILAVDYGLKRSGFAVCDKNHIICSPLEVYEGSAGLLERIKAIAEEYQASAIVLGLPLNMDGTEGGQAKKVREFAGQVAAHTGLKIYFQDERLTSREAQKSLVPAELTRKKRKKRLDAVAAAKILEAFLESNKNLSDDGN